MVDIVPGYVNYGIRNNISCFKFADYHIPNFIYKHDDILKNKNVLSNKDANLMYETAAKNRESELIRLNNAEKQGKISHDVYRICWHIYHNLVNEHKDTSLVNNGYYVDLYELTKFVIAADNQSALRVLRRYLFVTDLMVLDSFARNNLGVLNSTKSNIKSILEDAMNLPYDVDLQPLKIEFTNIEKHYSLPIPPAGKKLEDDDTYLLRNRLHNFGEKTNHNNITNNTIASDFFSAYRERMLVNASQVPPVAPIQAYR